MEGRCTMFWCRRHYKRIKSPTRTEERAPTWWRREHYAKNDSLKISLEANIRGSEDASFIVSCSIVVRESKPWFSIKMHPPCQGDFGRSYVYRHSCYNDKSMPVALDAEDAWKDQRTGEVGRVQAVWDVVNERSGAMRLSLLVKDARGSMPIVQDTKKDHGYLAYALMSVSLQSSTRFVLLPSRVRAYKI